MQTFLPYPDFAQSAACLDYKRLGKQRVEVKQLLLALGVSVGEHKPRTSAWSNHPAARMWAQNKSALVNYGIAVCEAWRARGYNDTLLPQFEDLEEFDPPMPRWLGREDFHLSHKSNLIRKDQMYYGKYWPEVPDNLEYIWP